MPSLLGTAPNQVSVNSDLGKLAFLDSAISNPVPASATAAGQTGQIAQDGSYLYICTAPNTWKRVAIAAW